MESASLTGIEAILDHGHCSIDELPLPYAELDESGRVVRVNRALLELAFPGTPDPVGRQAWDMMLPADGEEANEDYNEQLSSGEDPAPVRRAFFTRTGEFHSFDVYRRMIRDAEGKPAGMRILAVDTNDGLRALEEANSSRHWMEGLLNCLPEAVLAIDSLGCIIYSNRAMEQLTGWRADEILNRRLESLPIQEIHCEQLGKFGFENGLLGEVRFEATILDRACVPIRVHIHSQPFEDEGVGVTQGVVISIRRV